MSRFVVMGVVVAGVVGMVGGCGSAPDPIQRVILVVVDTLRGDHLACSGGPVATPNLDSLAARGVRFSNARANIPITGPSHSSLFTGLLPSQHGVLNNTQVLAEGFRTLPEMARDFGMRTAAFVSLGVLKQEYGFGQGFEFYDQRFRYSWVRNAAEINDAVIPWLEGVGDGEPFFVFAHFSDPHEPYAAPGQPFSTCRVLVNGEETAVIEADGRMVSIPAPLIDSRCSLALEYADGCSIRPKDLVIEGFRTKPRSAQILAGPRLIQTSRDEKVFIADLPVRFEIVADNPRLESFDIRFSVKHRLSFEESRRQYGFEVEYVDQQIGRLMATLENRGWVEDSLILFVADHGEGIGDHDHVGHIDQLYDSLLSVPLIIVAPGHVPESLVVDHPVSLIDVMPTIAELVGFQIPEGIRGESLVPLMTPGGTQPERPQIALTARPQAGSDLEAVVDEGWKLIVKRETGEVALFDLGADPGELTDLAPKYPERVAKLHRILDENLLSSSSTGAWAELDDESRSRLEALGYVN